VAFGGGVAPSHARGVVGDADLAVGAEEDDASVALEAAVEVVDGGVGGLLRGGAGCDAVDGPLAEDELHDGFAVSGERGGGGEVVGVAAAADEGAVADTAGGFGERAAGGGAGGEVAVGVEREGADGVVGVQGGIGDAELLGQGVIEFVIESDLLDRCTGEGGVRVAGGFGVLEVDESLALAGDDEFGVVDEGHAVLAGEALGACGGEVDVVGALEDEAGGLDWVAEALDGGDAAGREVGAAHEEGITLDAAVVGEEGATAGVEDVVIFHDGDGGLDGVDGGAAAMERGPAGGERIADAALMGFDGVVGDGPGAAVDEEGGLHRPHWASWSLRRLVSL
jgi:hypothetical protein